MKKKRAIIKSNCDFNRFLQTQKGHDFINMLPEEEVEFIGKENILMVKYNYKAIYFSDEWRKEIAEVDNKYATKNWRFSMSWGQIRMYRYSLTTNKI